MHHSYFILYASIPTMITLYIPPVTRRSLEQSSLSRWVSALSYFLPLSSSLLAYRCCCCHRHCHLVIILIIVFVILLVIVVNQRHHCRCCHHASFVILCHLFVCCSFVCSFIVNCLFNLCLFVPLEFAHFCNKRFEVSSAQPSRRHHTSCLPYQLSHHTCTTIAYAVAVTVVLHEVDCCVVGWSVRLSLSLSSCHHRHHCFLSSYLS